MEDLDDPPPVAREDEFALAPLVAYAFVDGDGGDAVGVFFAVADVFVEEDGTIQRRDDQARTACKDNVACYAVDARCLDGDRVSLLARTEIEFAHEFTAVQIPHENSTVKRGGEEGGESTTSRQCDHGTLVSEEGGSVLQLDASTLPLGHGPDGKRAVRTGGD